MIGNKGLGTLDSILSICVSYLSAVCRVQSKLLSFIKKKETKFTQIRDDICEMIRKDPMTKFYGLMEHL